MGALILIGLVGLCYFCFLMVLAKLRGKSMESVKLAFVSTIIYGLAIVFVLGIAFGLHSYITTGGF